MSEYDYDLFVIGAGSGGVRAARRAAAMGKRVAIAEESRFGGTCVIRGCVPKKLLVYASNFPGAFEDAAGYGFSVGETRFDWPALIANKDREIDRLEGIYLTNLKKVGVEVFRSRAVFEGSNEIRLLAEDRTVSAKNILVAVGGRPNKLDGLPGAEHCIVSDDIFHLSELPRSIAILGAGYIAIEFANIFAGLGSDVTLVYRGDEILRGFDGDIRRELHTAMERRGVTFQLEDNFKAVSEGEEKRLLVECESGKTIVADQVLLAVGRSPNTLDLGLDKAGIETDEGGFVPIDDYSRTKVDHVFAIGDVTDRIQLTPVAIHEAMCLVETLYGSGPVKPDLDRVPTAVFSHPEIGTAGLSEEDAAKRFDELEIYRTRFRPMKHTLSGREEHNLFKLVVDAETKRVVGAHVLSSEGGEMSQLLGIVVKAGLTKADFDATMAVHPTGAEEMVTQYEPSYRVVKGERVGE